MCAGNLCGLADRNKHECTRVPVTAVASCGALLLAAEGPLVHFYHASGAQYISTQRIFKAQAVHGIVVYSEKCHDEFRLIAWGGRHVRVLQVKCSVQLLPKPESLDISLSNSVKAPDWVFDISPRPSFPNELECQDVTCAAVTAHNALLLVIIANPKDDQVQNSR